MKRVLVVDSPEIDLHWLRAESRRGGVCLVYEAAGSRESFSRLVRRGPAMVVVTLEGLPGLDFEQIARAAREQGVPVLVIGGDTATEAEALGKCRGLYEGACRRSRLRWLPTIMDRLVREREEREQEKEHSRKAALKGPEEPLVQSADQVRELQRLATIGRLTGSIAHEINNPLESITNLVYLMSSDDQVPAQMRQYLDLVQQELERVAQISKQTLSFYRETQSPVRVTLSSLIDEVLVLYGRRVGEKRLEVVRRFESEEPVLVFPGEMRQVYSNLIANAIEATEPGGRLVVRMRRSVRWNGRRVEGMRVLIADSGCGMPADVRQNLGRPFYTTKGNRGTGLGLWVSQSILKRYGGEMRLRSSTGPGRRGTTFSVFVPLVPRARVVELVPVQHALSGQGAGEGAELIQLRASSS